MAKTTRNTPPWVLAMYLLGLVLLFVGERIVSGLQLPRIVLSSLGLLAVLVTTALRWWGCMGQQGERKKAERAMAVLATVGLVAVLLYALTAEPITGWLGIDGMSSIARQRYESIMTVAWVVLMLVSVVTQAFGEVALFPMRHAQHLEWRRVRDALLSGFTLAIAATYGAFLVFVAAELDIRADYSYFKTSSPSESTIAMTKTLTGPVRVLAFFPPVNEVRDEAAGYLRALEKDGSNISVEMHDRLLSPALAKEVRVTEDGVIVLEREQQRETIRLGTEMKGARQNLKQLDAEFQKALGKVLRTRRTAYLTVGHGELNDTKLEGIVSGRTARGIRELLEMQNYVVRDLGLVQGLGKEIPDDATIVLVLGPSEPFAQEEVEALEKHVKKGKRVLLALDPEGKANNEELAAIAGLKFRSDTLCHAENHGIRRRNPSDHGIIFSNRFSSHPSVSTLGRLGSRAMFFINAGSLDKAEGADASLKIDFVLKSLPGTWADTDGNFTMDSPQESPGMFNLVAAVNMPSPSKEKDKESEELRVFVVSDADALADATLMNPSHLNGNPQFVVDALRWLGGEESLAGEVQTTEDVRIEHTKQKDKVYFYLTIFGAPALVLAVGLLLTRRGRRVREGRKA